MSKRVLQEMLGAGELTEGYGLDFKMSPGMTKTGIQQVKKAISKLEAATKAEDEKKTVKAMKAMAKALWQVGMSVNDGGPLDRAWKAAEAKLDQATHVKRIPPPKGYKRGTTGPEIMR